jgi:hypothetical protein
MDNIIKFVNSHKIETGVLVIALIVLIMLHFQKEKFTGWDADFKCDLGNISQNGVNVDSESIKTIYVEGPSIVSSYFTPQQESSMPMGFVAELKQVVDL